MKDLRLVFAGVTGKVRTELDLSGVTDLVGEEGYFERLEDVVAAYQQLPVGESG